MKRIIYSVVVFIICFAITCIGAVLKDLTELETLSVVLIAGGIFGIGLLAIFWMCQLQENDW